MPRLVELSFGVFRNQLALQKGDSQASVCTRVHEHIVDPRLCNLQVLREMRWGRALLGGWGFVGVLLVT